MLSKDEYRAKLQDVVDRWRSEVDGLKAETDAIEENKRSDHDRKIEDLENRIAKIQAKLDQLEEEGEGLWDKLATEVDKILASMGEGLEKASAANETEAIKKNPEE